MLSLSIGLIQNVAAQSGGGSTFTPASVSGMDLWLEADPTKLYTDAGTTLVSADGQAVEQANDKSSAAHNVTQTTLANRPLYKTDLAKPSLLCDGSNDFLQTTGSLPWTDGSGQFWFALSLQPGSTAGTQEVVHISGATGYVGDVYLNTSAHMETQNTASSFQEDSSGTLTVGTPVVIICTVITGAAEVFVDNVSNGSSALTGTLKTDSHTISIGSNSGTNPFNGRLFGVVHGTGTLSSTDRASLQTYMAALHP